jgi:hypothetical protein
MRFVKLQFLFLSFVSQIIKSTHLSRNQSASDTQNAMDIRMASIGNCKAVLAQLLLTVLDRVCGLLLSASCIRYVLHLNERS